MARSPSTRLPTTFFLASALVLLLASLPGASAL
jgi:hypothetical protein